MIITNFLLITTAFLFRALHYERRLGYLQSTYKLYFEYLDIRAKSKKEPQNSKDKERQGLLYRTLLERQEIVKKYIMEAGLENPKISVAKPIGYGAISAENYAVLDNITQNQIEIADIFNQAIQRAMGYHKHNRNESLNPLFWPEYVVLKLPKSLISKTIAIVKSSLAH